MWQPPLNDAPKLGVRKILRAQASDLPSEHDGQVPLSPTQQRNAVSEGFALGLVMCGRTSLPFDKVRVDLAFAGAWRGWDWRHRFAQVNTDLSKGLDATWALTRATEAKRTWAFFWDTSCSALTIIARQSDWDPEAEDDVEFALEVIGGEIPLEGWVSLAQEFLRRLDR